MFEEQAINIAQDVCITQAQYAQAIQQATNQAHQFGIWMLITGFVIGYACPRIAAYIKTYYGWTPE